MREKFSPKFLIHEGFKIFYTDLESTLQTLDEIFVAEVYRWISSEKSPLIIDAGANIGLSCLYFKWKYPEARILCFEPDPTSFNLLCMNIQSNHLKGVRTICAALSDHKGSANFYGQVDKDHTDARGNSLIEEWGLQRKSSQRIFVQTLSLQEFLHEPVSLLKLDVEGAEERILRNIKNNMKEINNIFIEFHSAPSLHEFNNLDRSIELLRGENFSVKVRPGETGIFPQDVLLWANRTKPNLYHIQAANLRMKNDKRERIREIVESQR